MSHTVFLVEDDPSIRDSLAELLARYGYRCLTTQCFEDVAGQILASEAQLVLLDLGLPQYDGYHICRALRSRTQIPIIVVTSRATELDELMSMNLGADDFLTKPYNTQILLARMARLLQRAYPDGAASTLTGRGLVLNLGRGTVSYQGRELELTKNEQRLLARFLRQPDQIVSRAELMHELWQSDAFVDDNTLTVNITRLRKKLEELGASGLITARRGQGYQL
ncbi:MAG: response regulator transcription factor [Oscillospiraceae bacterium]|nr:response regulator transcription factor [Oscillospiraceae bacterium]